MNILENISLSQHSTMRLGGNARYLCLAESNQDITEAVAWAEQKQVSIITIGGGSNIIWRDEGFDGLIIVNQILGYQSEAQADDSFLITVGAGENWDSLVERTVGEGLSGIEALSLIPGTTGATPVQNVGAYGQEISQTLVSLEAYDLNSHEFVNIDGPACGFSYRQSRFNQQDRGKFIITSLKLKLSKLAPQPPFYGSVQQFLDSNNISSPTSADIRRAVIEIRRAKLPDPALVANCGSFFGNPIVDQTLAEKIAADFPGLPQMPADQPGKVKIPAAWLIEQAGFKNYNDNQTGMSTWPNQPLVLVNQSAKSTADLLAFKQKIVSEVTNKFAIELVQEPELLPLS